MDYIQLGAGTNVESPWDFSCWPSDCRVWRLLCFRNNWGLRNHWGMQNLNMWKVRCAAGDAGECWGGTRFCWGPSFFKCRNWKKFSMERISFQLKQRFLLWLSLCFVHFIGCVPYTLFSEDILGDEYLTELTHLGEAYGLWPELSFRMFQWAIKELWTVVN